MIRPPRLSSCFSWCKNKIEKEQCKAQNEIKLVKISPILVLRMRSNWWRTQPFSCWNCKLNFMLRKISTHADGGPPSTCLHTPDIGARPTLSWAKSYSSGQEELRMSETKQGWHEGTKRRINEQLFPLHVCQWLDLNMFATVTVTDKEYLHWRGFFDFCCCYFS